MHQLAGADDERADAGADERPTQDDQCGGEAAHGQRRRGYGCHPAAGNDRRERDGVTRQATM